MLRERSSEIHVDDLQLWFFPPDRDSSTLFCILHHSCHQPRMEFCWDRTNLLLYLILRHVY